MKKSVMVIDDDRGIRSFLQKSLFVKGYEVALAERGAPGLQQLLAGKFDLVFLDLNMPEISGQTICSALRKHEQTRTIPVVMMTAMFQTEQQMADAMREYGASAFLLKPFSVADLFEVVESLIGKSDDVGEAPAAPVEAQPEPTEAEDVTDETPPVVDSGVISGKLAQQQFPRLLHQLYQQKLTGLLHLQNKAAKKVIYIKNGYPVFARSNILGECLGRMLVKDDVITQVDCDQSVERSKSSGRLQGTELIEMGLLTPEDLHAALKKQVTEKLLNVFAWTEGQFRFLPQADFRKNITSIELSPAGLILEGVSKYWNRDQIENYLRPHLIDYVKQAENPLYLYQEMGLSRRGEEVFAECLGDLSLEKILERHPLSRREVQQVMVALVISGMVTLRTTASRLDDEARAQRKAERPVDGELRKEILEDYKRIMSSDYFTALGVEHQCDSGMVRRAYYKLAKLYHPDRFLGRGLSNDMENKVNEIFGHVTQAYSVLSNPTLRSSYRDELEHGPKGRIDVNQVIEAETAFQQGRGLLKVRQFKAAAAKLKISIELSPEEPEYLTSYAWALFKSAPENDGIQNKTLEILLSSRELNPGLEETHLFLGYVYQALGKERQSEKSFEMAVQANPKSTEALRELRLINLRRGQQEPSKGLFKKFLNKE
ncbi:response regulator [Geopsychrobacter electrodiphilus]|uniref:response regulator n=1 Tax=Geopsychrobacter electrodiphilus TaxID=225196 RepID=UPI00037A7444|nr:response regulator [Geopsychrobacter electrodiphilus]